MKVCQSKGSGPVSDGDAEEFGDDLERLAPALGESIEAQGRALLEPYAA